MPFQRSSQIHSAPHHVGEGAADASEARAQLALEVVDGMVAQARITRWLAQIV